MGSSHEKRGRRVRSRAAALSVAAALLVALFVGVMAVGCGGDDEPADDGGDAGAMTRGGVLKVGIETGNGQWDPVLQAGAIGDIFVICQVQENLVWLAQDFSLLPGLATEWTTEDGTVWKFTLQDGVTFSNGEAFTAEDVVYSFDRLKMPESPMADTYSNIESVVADDATNVTFNLKVPDSEFPALLTDYRAKMLCKSVEDPMAELVGTGPFVLDSYTAEDRAVLTANPDYWGTDENGEKLPYLDGVEFVFSPDPAGRLQGLLGGSLNWVGGLTAEQMQQVEADSNLQLLSTETNYCYELQIRCDEGLGSNLAFRQALMYGTDRQAIIDLTSPGIADAGNGTLVGPAYAAYYREEQIPFDQEMAKQLLADAGYNGETIKLVAQTTDPVPALATAWQAQMKEIGVNVDIQQVPPDVYYTDEGEDTWYQAEFSFVDWGTRAIPILYFQLALKSDAPWNYSRWENAEFDKLVDEIPQAVDEADRAELYKQAQEILQDEVPMINFLVLTALAGQSGDIQGVELDPDWVHTRFTTAYYTQ